MPAQHLSAEATSMTSIALIKKMLLKCGEWDPNRGGNGAPWNVMVGFFITRPFYHQWPVPETDKVLEKRIILWIFGDISTQRREDAKD